MDHTSSEMYMSKLLRWEKQMEEDGFAFLKSMENMEQQLKMMSTQLEKLQILQEQYTLASQEVLRKNSMSLANAILTKEPTHLNNADLQSNKQDMFSAGSYSSLIKENQSYFSAQDSLVQYSDTQLLAGLSSQAPELLSVHSSVQKNYLSTPTQTENDVYLQNYSPLSSQPTTSDLLGSDYQIHRNFFNGSEVSLAENSNARDNSAVPLSNAVHGQHARPGATTEKGVLQDLVSAVTKLAEVPGQYMRQSGNTESRDEQNKSVVSFVNSFVNLEEVADVVSNDVLHQGGNVNNLEHENGPPQQENNLESHADTASNIVTPDFRHIENLEAETMGFKEGPVDESSSFVDGKLLEQQEQTESDLISASRNEDHESSSNEGQPGSEKTAPYSLHPAGSERDSSQDHPEVSIPEASQKGSAKEEETKTTHSTQNDGSNRQRKASVQFLGQTDSKSKLEDMKKGNQKVTSKKSKPGASKSKESLSATDSDDSFFDRDLPLTSSAAYRSLLGATAQVNPVATVEESESESGSEDEVERALAMAVKRKSSRLDVPSVKSSSRTTELSPPSSSVTNQKKEKTGTEKNKTIQKASAVSRKSISMSASTSKVKLSKSTRKALGLDSESDEPSIPKKTQQESSDEFDFYD